MMNRNNPTKSLTNQEKQFVPLPGEIDPKDAKVKAFMAIQKAKGRFPAEKLKR